LQGIALGGWNRVKGGFEFSLGQLQRLQAVGLQAVKAGGVLQHRGITTHLHIAQDVGHALLNGGIGVGGPVQTGLNWASNWLSASKDVRE
jgi:hypothetical protein